MDIDMNLRLREMMALRLDDAVGDMKFRVTTDPITQLLRALCESCLWLIRDWPNQKIDNSESVHASRLDTLGRLRQLLRVRPPKNSEMDGLILLLADAMLTISEQWPGGEIEPSTKPTATVFASPAQPIHQLRAQMSLPISSTATPASVHIPPVYGAQGTSCQPPAQKLPRLAAKPWTVDGTQQPSTSSSNSQSFPPHSQHPEWKMHREMPQASNAGSPSALWTFFTKAVGESGELLAKCSVCHKMIARHNHGTTGMKKHLKIHHPAEFATLGMDSSASSENSQSSPPRIESEASRCDRRRADESAAPVSAIVAALTGGSTLPEMNDSPLFNNEHLVKEEEVEYDEELSTGNNFLDESTSSHSMPQVMVDPASQRPSRNSSSDIWTYFVKADGENGDKMGCCKLCEWSRKIYNYGTNTMWSHLRKDHPFEYTILKPHEYNPPVHGQFYPGDGSGEAS